MQEGINCCQNGYPSMHVAKKNKYGAGYALPGRAGSADRGQRPHMHWNLASRADPGEFKHSLWRAWPSPSPSQSVVKPFACLPQAASCAQLFGKLGLHGAADHLVSAGDFSCSRVVREGSSESSEPLPCLCAYPPVGLYREGSQSVAWVACVLLSLSASGSFPSSACGLGHLC